MQKRVGWEGCKNVRDDELEVAIFRDGNHSRMQRELTALHGKLQPSFIDHSFIASNSFPALKRKWTHLRNWLGLQYGITTISLRCFYFMDDLSRGMPLLLTPGTYSTCDHDGHGIRFTNHVPPAHVNMGRDGCTTEDYNGLTGYLESRQELVSPVTSWKGGLRV